MPNVLCSADIDVLDDVGSASTVVVERGIGTLIVAVSLGTGLEDDVPNVVVAVMLAAVVVAFEMKVAVVERLLVFDAEVVPPEDVGKQRWKSEQRSEKGEKEKGWVRAPATKARMIAVFIVVVDQ